MKISSLIFEYLVEHNHVGILGFGEFNAEPQEAYIHPIDHGFAPANKKIKFRLDKNVVDDGFLAFLTQKTEGSESESKVMLKKAIDEWVKLLRAGQEVDFEGLGVIKVSASKTVVFIENLPHSLNKQFFGLQDFKMEPLNRIKATSIAAAMGSKTEDKPTKKRPVFIWVAAVFVVVILGVSFWLFKDNIFGPRLADNSKTQADVSVVTKEQPTEDSLTEKKQEQNNLLLDTVADDLNDTVEMQSENTVQLVDNEVEDQQIEEVSQPIEEEKTIEIVPFVGMRYFVIAGCFKSKTKAKNFLSTLQEKGYAATIEGKTSGGLIRVCYGSYSSWREASKSVLIINEKEATSAWVQKITN